MKSFKTITAIFLVSALTFTGMISLAQDNKTDPQRKEELLKAIDEQKKAMNEQKKALDEQQKELQKNQDEMAKNFDYNFDNNGGVRVYRRKPFNGSDNFNIYVPNPPDAPMIAGNHWFMGDNEMTSWDFSKNIKEGSFKKEYAFDVEKTAKSVSISVSGDCKAGEIRVKILTPQGKTYSDVVIDENGNLNVRKSFNISEEENQDKTGEWKFVINSDKATGYFRISFQTY